MLRLVKSSLLEKYKRDTKELKNLKKRNEQIDKDIKEFEYVKQQEEEYKFSKRNLKVVSIVTGSTNVCSVLASLWALCNSIEGNFLGAVIVICTLVPTALVELGAISLHLLNKSGYKNAINMDTIDESVYEEELMEQEVIKEECGKLENSTNKLKEQISAINDYLELCQSIKKEYPDEFMEYQTLVEEIEARYKTKERTMI